MRFGIEDSVWLELIAVVQKYKDIDRMILFGSRAIGTFRSNSDIDLVIFSNDFTFRRFLDLKGDLDDLGLLYHLDLIDFNQITNEELKAHILRVGQTLYDVQDFANKKGLQNLI